MGMVILWWKNKDIEFPSVKDDLEDFVKFTGPYKKKLNK